MKHTVVVNLFGGPGIGKSTMAAGVFHALKKQHVECELVQEYAKDLVWEGHTEKLEDSLYVLAKQNRRIQRLNGQVDFVITDSPVLLGAVYAKEESIRRLARELHNKQESINFILCRNSEIEYNGNGRVHSENEAIELDRTIRRELNKDHFIAFDIEGILSTIARMIETGSVCQ